MAAPVLPVNGLEGLGGLKGTVNIPESILTNPAAQPQAPDRVGFNELLGMAVKSVSNSQINADTAMQQLAAGQNIELHNVVLAAQKASLTLQLALQIKNKITEAYQEVMRMQI